MSDTAKMLLLTVGFMLLSALAVIFKSVLLLCVTVAIASSFTTALVHEPYKVISVMPKEKNIKVKKMEESK